MTEPDFTDIPYSATDGLRLNARVYGAANREHLPVICLPGLTRNARDFHDLALFLARRAKNPRKVVAFDYRGRGRSQYDKDWRNYNFQVETGDVMAGMTAMGIEDAAFIGTSRGGLILFMLATQRPAAIKAVVLNDVGPVLDGVGLAQIHTTLKRAPRPSTFEEAVRLQRSTNGEAFSALDDADWQRLVRALYREEDGKPVADYDPALANTMKSVDLGKPLPVLWPQFLALSHSPILAIRGANSRLLSAKTLELMKERHPRLTSITVEGQGHAPLLETGGLPEKIAAFIDASGA